MRIISRHTLQHNYGSVGVFEITLYTHSINQTEVHSTTTVCYTELVMTQRERKKPSVDTLSNVTCGQMLYSL